MRVAIVMTVFNRLEKTRKCLSCIRESLSQYPWLKVKIFLTDDGSSDNTAEVVPVEFKDLDIQILKGDGNLFWNAGMNNSWREAIREGGYDGYLWMNNDTYIHPNLWEEIKAAEEYSQANFGKSGIYVGSTQDEVTKEFTYGGFDYVNKWTLLDSFKIPNGEFQLCQCAHGNVTYVSDQVVKKMGVLCEKYLHGGGDHDYTYLAHKAGFPLIVLREYVAYCENDHGKEAKDFNNMNMKQRFKYLYSPRGLNLHNSLLMQRRCFPHRYLLVLTTGYLRALFPNLYSKVYMYARTRKNK
ncbi:MAG: glycosyltransferase [Bacteroidales bacterium]|nr:glycosyltransferase [Bacteroidales bacterium]